MKLPPLPVVLAALALQAVSAQEPPAEPRQPALSEEVHVRLVQTPILAIDRKGRPITDVTAEEIRIQDRGRRREVAFLDPLVRSEPGEPLPKTLLFLDAPGAVGNPVAESAADEPRYMAIVVDVENDPALRREEAARDAVRFVHERVTPASHVAVFSYTGVIEQELLFASGDVERVAAAVTQAFGRTGRPKVDLRARVRDLVREMEDCVTDSGAFVATGNQQCMRDSALSYADQLRPAAQEYLDALEGLIRMMGGLRGRKVIYALSHGVSMDPTAEIAEAMRAVLGPTEQVADMINYLGFSEGARTEMDRLMELALREGVVFHFIDRTPPPTTDHGASQAHGYQPGTRPALAAHTAAQDDLEEIATSTGGRFIAETDVFEGLNEALDLESGTYILGYYVDEFLTPRQLRKVSIDCTRKGVKLTYRRGYYDVSPHDDVSGKVFVGEVAPAKSRRSAELGLAGYSFVPFQIVADPTGIRYETAGELAVANLTLHVQIQDAAGRVVADGFRFLAHSYPLDVWQSGKIEPVRINGWAELPAGTYQLIALLRNPANARQGQWVATLEIPERE